MTARTKATPTPAADSPTPPPGQLVGVFQTLAKQHDQVAELLAQLKASPETRATMWPQIRRALVSHEHGEVRELYPLLRQHEATSALADHHDDEARDLDALIGRLDTVDIRDEGWLDLFDQLTAAVLHHAKDEEEARIFPLAQQVLGEARAIELDAKLMIANQQLAEAN